MIAINRKTPAEVFRQVALHARERRLQMKLTQEGLAHRAGISLGSLKRFERTGHIAFLGLLKIAFVLDCLKEFENLFTTPMPIQTLDELINAPAKHRRRGTLK